MPSPPSTTTQIQKVELPKWVEAASESNYNLAKGISDRPYEAYKGPTVADMPKFAKNYFDATAGTGQLDISRSRQMLNKAATAGDPDFAAARQLFTRGAGGVNSLNRSAYTNPFIGDVEDRAIDALGRERDLELNDNASRATAAKAFGGSRSAIIDAITRSETARSAGDLSAGLRKEGYDRATGAMQSDLDRMLASGQQRMGLGSSQIDALLKSAGGLQSNADLAQKIRLGNFSGHTQLATQSQQGQQKRWDDAFRKWKEKRDYPLEGLNTRLSALGMSPYGKTETTHKEEKTGTDFASIGGGILSMLPALFMLSDETTKEKISKKPLVIDNDTGIPIYEYRYKGEPKSMRRIGPMAQDVRKAFPERVQRVAGKLAIRMA